MYCKYILQHNKRMPVNVFTNIIENIVNTHNISLVNDDEINKLIILFKKHALINNISYNPCFMGDTFDDAIKLSLCSI
jgi:hypothetical protein